MKPVELWGAGVFSVALTAAGMATGRGHMLALMLLAALSAHPLIQTIDEAASALLGAGARSAAEIAGAEMVPLALVTVLLPMAYAAATAPQRLPDTRLRPEWLILAALLAGVLAAFGVPVAPNVLFMAAVLPLVQLGLWMGATTRAPRQVETSEPPEILAFRAVASMLFAFAAAWAVRAIDQ